MGEVGARPQEFGSRVLGWGFGVGFGRGFLEGYRVDRVSNPLPRRG